MENMYFLQEYRKFSRKERLQHKRVLYWNHSEFCIFVQNIIYHQLKIWLFIYHMFTLNDIKYLWFDTISTAENSQVIMNKYASL